MTAEDAIGLLPANLGVVITQIKIETLNETLTISVPPTTDYAKLNRIIGKSLQTMAKEERESIAAGVFAPRPEEELRKHYERIQVESHERGDAPARWRALCVVSSKTDTSGAAHG